VCFLLVVTSALSAQSQPPCTAPPYRQFEFWVGEWEVRRPDGALAGGLEGDRMVLTGVLPSASDSTRLDQQRVTWSPLPRGKVRQLWEASSDGGQSWTTVFDRLYERKR